MNLTPMSWPRCVTASSASPTRRNSSWIQRVPVAHALAGALLAGASMLSGCLMPQDDYVLPAEPRFVNRAPRFIDALLQPASAFIQQNGNVGSCPLQFTVAAEDEDVADILRVRFYVDYDSENNPGFKSEFEFLNNGTAQRATVTWNTDVAAPGNLLGPIGAHTVEAVLFDGSLGLNREPDPRSTYPDGGVEDPSYVVFHRWVVDTKSGVCP